ncbi:MAG TPA: right-handed parallel beta-helix repeat-containing protein [Kiritimatiellia bacterium]|nr:right-handed parallel beta-helix repeat-containing protein [Kiritimatiellia bacterium]
MHKSVFCGVFVAMLFASETWARTITCEGVKTDGVVTSFNLTFGASADGKTLGLYCAYGSEDCGSDPAAWPDLRRWATVPSTVNVLGAMLPPNWGVSVFALRFFLFEEENASLGYDSRVDYLQSTGVQVIDSTYRANGNSRFVLEMTGMPSPLHSEGFVFGYRSTHCAPDSFGLYQHCGKNHWKTPGWRYGTQIFTGSADTNAHHIQNRCIVSNDLSRIYVSQNGVATCINPDAPDDCGFTSSWNLAIFGAYYTSNRDTTGLVQTRIHSLSFYEGDTAQREFIPVLKDGVPGLWDNVNGQFYPKTAGSADFLYGERLDNPVGATTFVSSSEPWVRAEPNALFNIAASGMAIHGFGTLYTCGDGNNEVDVYLACAKSTEELPAPTLVWQSWKDDLDTRFNTMIKGLEPSTAYNYSAYVMNPAGVKSLVTNGTFTTGPIIEVAVNEDPVSAVNAAAAGSEVRIAEGTYVISGTMAPKASVAVVGQGAGAVLDANFVVDRRHVYTSVAHVTLDNLTFKNARHETHTGYANWVHCGAAVRFGNNGGNSTSSQYAWITNCLFSANTNVNEGAGGLFMECANKVVDCVFENNYGGPHPMGGLTGCGAAFVHHGNDYSQFSHCIFKDNDSGSYGVVGSGTYTSGSALGMSRYGFVCNDCVFTNNTSTSGGILAGKISMVKRCEFIGNRSANGGVCWAGSPDSRWITNRFEQCVFRNNSASAKGGVIASDYWRYFVFTDCAFIGNVAATAGSVFRGNGDFLCTGCLFTGNDSTSATLGNVADANGTMIAAQVPRLYDCTVSNNTATGYSLVYVYNNADGGKFHNTRFIANLLSGADGTDIQRGVLWPHKASEIRNCLFAVNTNACGYGCAIALYSNSNEVDNCTVTGNRCYSEGNSGCVGIYRNTGTENRIRNCIVTDNRNLTQDNLLHNFYGQGIDQVSYSLEDGTQLPNGVRGNINEADPRFVSPEKGDYSLFCRSPARNAGVNDDWMLGAKDLAGQDRILDDVVDMGCYEYRTIPGFMIRLH